MRLQRGDPRCIVRACKTIQINQYTIYSVENYTDYHTVLLIKVKGVTCIQKDQEQKNCKLQIEPTDYCHVVFKLALYIGEINVQN